jgi:hypothetical protein
MDPKPASWGSNVVEPGMRCSNCGGQVVVPNVAAPFFSCKYCHATIQNPAYQHAVLSISPAPASAKLKYALGGGLLVLLGAGLSPVAMSMLAAPASSAAAAATSTAPNGATATTDALPPAVAVPVVGNGAAAKVEGKLGAAPVKAEVPAAAALSQPPTAAPVAAAAATPLHPSHPTLPPEMRSNVGGASGSSSTASSTTAPAVSTVPTNVQVSMGSPSIVSGTYSIDAIRRVVGQASGGVRACYLKGFVERPTMKQGGALPVSFQIQPDGTVRGAGVSGFVDVPSNTVSCINRTIGGLQFPPSEGWTKVKTTVTLSANQ